VSALEERLRDAFRTEAQTVRPEDIPGPPARPARRASRQARSGLSRALVPLAAAAAVGAVVAGATLALPQSGGRGHLGPATSSSAPARCSSPCPAGSGFPWPSGPLPFRKGLVPRPVLGPAASRGVSASASSPGTPPRFYVTFGGGPLVVRGTATGAITGKVGAPARSGGFGTIAAPAGDRTFLAAVLSSQANTCLSQLYQFQLDSQGRPGPLTPLNITIPGSFSELGTLAVTPDGSTIAYSTTLCGTSQGEVGVIRLATRQVRIWTTYGDNSTWGLSLSSDGRQIAFGQEFGGAWVLSTSAAPGPVSQRARLVSRTAGWAALAADGASLDLCRVAGSSSAPRAPRRGTVTYAADSLATGQQQVIASWADRPYPQCWASLDPSGQYLLVQYPVSVPDASDWVRPAILDLRSGRLTDINAPAYYGPLDVAW